MSIETVPPCPIVTIDESGITAPLFVDKHEWLKTLLRGIFGDDIYIDNDSQDGQLIGALAKAMFDADSSVVAAYNSFSPSTAQGAGLSRVTKINGIRKKIATKSSVDLRIVGWAGTVITKGYAIDLAGNRWILPDVVTIPSSSEIIVTATAGELGSMFAPPHSINRIGTIVRGWQTVDNPEASTVGNPVEDDSMLRVRQSISTSIPSKSTYESLVGAVAAVEGTNRYRGYENETTGPDEWGLPQNSVSIVVEGGDAQEIATIIFKKKAPGTTTYGTTSEDVLDVYGIPHTIYFSRPIQVPVQAIIPVQPLARFTASKDLAIRNAVSDWINSHNIGETVSIEEIGHASMLATDQSPRGDPTFRVLPGTRLARIPATPSHTDVEIEFNERPTCTAADVLLDVNGLII